MFSPISSNFSKIQKNLFEKPEYSEAWSNISAFC